MDKVPAATISGQAPKPVGALCNSQLQPQQFVSLRGSGRLRPFSGSFHDLLSSCGIVSDAAFPNLFRNFPDNVSTRPTLGPRARISIHLASQSGKLSISCENRIKRKKATFGIGAWGRRVGRHGGAANPPAHRSREAASNAPPAAKAWNSRAHQKKYFSVLARNSVVAGRISTRHTAAYSDHGPGISVSQMISDRNRGPDSLRWIRSWNIACPSEDEKNRQRRSNRSDGAFSAAIPWDTRLRSSTYSLR